MSLNCPKCAKSFKTSQRLTEHLRRKNPCDRVCLICGKKYANQRGFHAHRKTHLEQQIEVEELEEKSEELIEESEELEELEPIQQVVPQRSYKAHRAQVLQTQREPPKQVTLLKELFPLEDFEWETIVAEREETRTVNNKIIIEKVTYERTEIRGPIIEKLLRWGPLNAALIALQHGSDKREIMKQILYQVHGQPSEPHFHSLCKTDLSRNTISVFTRADPEQDAKWIKANFKAMKNKLDDHARNLTLFVLQAGINALEIQYWVPKKQVVFMFTANGYQTLLYREKNMLIYKRNVAVNQFIDCDATQEREINDLMMLLEKTKETAMQEIRTQSLTKQIFDDFFNYQRVKGVTARQIKC